MDRPDRERADEQRQRQQAEIRIPGIESWIRDIPPITRTWAFACVAVGIAIQCEFIAPVQLYFSWKTVFQDGQFWRIFTNFMYFGNFSFDLAYHLFFIVSAQYLPFCLIGLSWAMYGIKSETMGDAVGLIAGHLYYTIQDAWPREMTHPTGKPILVAPRWM
ncbi:hypothetical protein QFC20_007232 [Naganishia adeliensis]|uniref:Uncharacterized protein n=1 Tax=Naganishia adeliensis TaxID=92952 RepID=A0ACC2V1B8_9TREE|nr:hypothetical protein QFC20_007232 [Naganishia adeliensis]